MNATISPALDVLSTSVDGRVVRPDDADYDERRAVLSSCGLYEERARTWLWRHGWKSRCIPSPIT